MTKAVEDRNSDVNVESLTATLRFERGEHTGAPTEGQMFAAVDLGSNSFHLIVARYEHGQLRVIDRLREAVRLAAGLNEDGDLDPGAWDRAVACLARFGERLADVPPQNARALATSTLRRARDPGPFLLVAETALGHSIEVISGHEEARLIYLGVAQDLAARAAKRLVIDIGGGSTEFIVGRGTEPEQLETVSAGCVDLSERFFPGGKLSRANFKAAETAVALEIRPIRRAFRAAGWEAAVGTSGTIRAAGRILQTAGWGMGTVTSDGLKQLRRALVDAGRISRLELPGLSPERQPVFPGGIAILSACFRNLDIDEMRVSEYALREGALYDLVGRTLHEDPRPASVAALASRYGVDTVQAERVRVTAGQAFEQVSDSWGLSDAHGELLGWAALLHEVGLAISHDHYHRHSAYLAKHSELNGFTRLETLVLATLILAHRRKVTPETFAILPQRLVQSVSRTAVLLRLAVLLHRSRQSDEVPDIRWEATDAGIALTFPVGWLGVHPLTHEDLSAERRYLARIGIALGFE